MKKPLVMLSALCLTAASAPPGYDIVVRGGRVLDGAGNPWVSADVGIIDDRIVTVGSIAAKGRQEIDARGKLVTPGFIDMMDQSGAVLVHHGGAPNKLLMGVTTLIAGEGGTPVKASAIRDYFSGLRASGIAVNFGTYYSLHQARVEIMGDKAGPASPAQISAMQAEVETAMQAGVFGVSTALIYPPGSFQTRDELIALAKPAGRCGGFYASHIRDESANLVDAVTEAIAIGQGSGTKVEIFHLKAAYAPAWGKLMPRALKLIQDARDSGQDVAADLYPYTAGGTGLSITVPNWVFEKGEANAWKLLRDPGVRARLKKEVAAGSQPGWSNLVEASGGWTGIVLANPFAEKWEKYRGQSIAAIAQDRKMEPADVAWDIVLDALPNRAMALFFMMDEQDIERALQQKWTSIGTDAAAAETLGKVDDLGLPHPRAYGTFPRILAEYVMRRKTLSIEEAIRKMTSWPAARMGIQDRGLVRPGMKADLLVFDPAAIEERADWQNPTASPVGIDWVLVNGDIAVAEGKLTGSSSGEILTHQCRQDGRAD